jgi:ATP-dependent DNA ligase
MFEKYDGIRAFWNPHYQTFFSRTGKTFTVPSSIAAAMPNVVLDGEIWYVVLR